MKKGRYLFCPNGSHLAIYDDQKVYVGGSSSSFETWTPVASDQVWADYSWDHGAHGNNPPGCERSQPPRYFLQSLVMLPICGLLFPWAGDGAPCRPTVRQAGFTANIGKCVFIRGQSDTTSRPNPNAVLWSCFRVA